MNSSTLEQEAAISVHSKALNKEVHVQRKIGHFSGTRNGPTIIFTAGIHGNEPSGIFALQDVINELQTSNISISGKVYALTGNMSALSDGERYIDQDLNRLWGVKTIHNLKKGLFHGDTNVEYSRELPELFRRLETIFEENSGPFYVIDLHTTSSETNPFLTIGDTLRNRAFAMQFPVPVIVGIEEQLDSTLLNYINELGHIAIGVESGQHDSLASIEYHRAIVWLAMIHAGCIDQKELTQFLHYHHVLAKTTVDSKKIFEIRYRYEIETEENFSMLPGFVNFQKVKKSQEVAVNVKGNVLARESGRIFMPLYQKQGNDGFFLVREIRPFWLKLSAVFRKWKVDRMLPVLPGIKLHDAISHTFLINKRIARWYVIEFFHLLGYRKEWQEGRFFIMTKREFDLKGPMT